MFALPAAMAKGGDHLVGIGKKRGAKRIIQPRPGNHAGTDLWPDLMRIEINDGIQSGRVDKPLFRKNCLERLDPKGWFGRQQAMRIVIMMVVWHGAILVRKFFACPETCDTNGPIARNTIAITAKPPKDEARPFLKMDGQGLTAMPLPQIFDQTLRLPLIAAPMFLASGPELVMACCRAGIIGSFPAKNQRTCEGLDEWLTEIGVARAAIEGETGRPLPPFAVNLIVHRSNDVLQDELEVVIRHRVPLVITSLGAVPELVGAVHDYGGLVFHDVINLRHARKAIEAGVDGLIAVAAGAGGHTGKASPFALINEIRQVFDGALMLSGALSTGGDIAAAQVMGADLAYMGTRFIGTAECRSPDAYKAMIVDSTVQDVVATDRVSGVDANFLAASLAEAGIGPDGGAEQEAGINRDVGDALSARTNERTAWRDIWSAGHGVGSIADVPRVADLVDRLEAEYHAALAAQTRRVSQLRDGG